MGIKSKRVRCQKGATAVEYSLSAAVVLMLMLPVVGLKQSVSDTFNDASRGLNGAAFAFALTAEGSREGSRDGYDRGQDGGSTESSSDPAASASGK